MLKIQKILKNTKNANKNLTILKIYTKLKILTKKAKKL